MLGQNATAQLVVEVPCRPAVRERRVDDPPKLVAPEPHAPVAVRDLHDVARAVAFDPDLRVRSSSHPSHAAAVVDLVFEHVAVLIDRTRPAA